MEPNPVYDENLLPEMLPVYYSRLFPQNVFCRWLSCGNIPQPLAHRELSFTLADDVYLRYLSFANQKELQALLQKKNPYKIDIGAVYNTKPSIARHGSLVLSRELVFDIDLTDYDDVRTCCQEAKVCGKCWKFMVIACEVLDKALRDDFGFQHILWVFSGRRGIHCWVSDYEARTLDGPGRAAVADYLCLVVGGENQTKKVHLGNDNLHSSIRRAVVIISKHFDELLLEQQFLSTPEGLKKFYAQITDESLRNQIEKNINNVSNDSSERWSLFQQTYQIFCKENGSAKRKIKYLIEEIQLQYCYPRLDVNVTKGFNHLLKSPFSIHPKTGRVCIVFKPNMAKELKLDAVPTIHSLVDNAEESSEHQTNLRTAIKNFQEVVFSLEKSESKRKRNDGDTTLEF